MANSRLSKLASDYGGDLLVPAATLASGGSKLAAGMQLAGGVIVTKVLGPLGAVAGLITGIVVSLVKWEQTAQLVAKAMDKAAAKEAMTKQFAELTKSVATAKAKLQDLFQFAEKSPFRFESIIEGGKALQQLSKGALLTKDNLKLVGDVAAASGQQFGTAAQAVGQFYGDLQNGRPIKQSAEELRDMGVVSQATVDKVVALQAAGAGLSSTWNIARADLEKTKGAMQGVAQTIEELQGKRETTKAGILAPAGAIYNEGAKRGLEAQNQLLEKAAPVLTTLGQIVARVSVGFGYLQSGIVRMIASMPGLTSLIGAAVTAFTMFGTAVIALSATRLVVWLTQALVATKNYGNAAVGAARGAAVEAEANSKLAASFKQVVAGATEAATAVRAYGSGLFGGSPGGAVSGAGKVAGAEAVVEEGKAVEKATLAGGAATALAGAKNLAFVGTGKLLRAALTGIAEGFAYLGKGMLRLVTMSGGPVIVLLSAIATAAVYLTNRYDTATESIKTFGDATAKSSSQLKQHIADIKTAADQANAYQEAIALAKTGQDEFNAALVQQTANDAHWYGGFLDMVDKIPSKMKAANDVVEAGTQARTAITAKTPGLALTEDQNQAVLAQQLAEQKTNLDLQLVGVSPEARLKILQDRAAAAKRELDAKNRTENARAAMVLTTPETMAMASTPEAEQAAIEAAQKAKQAADDALAHKVSGPQATVVGGAMGSGNLQDVADAARAQDAVKVQQDAANAAAALEGAKATAKRNAALRAQVASEQMGRSFGSEQIAAQDAVTRLTLAGASPKAIQEAQRNADAVTAKYETFNEAIPAAAQEQLSQKLASAQVGAQQPIVAEAARAASGAPLTPEQQLESAQKIAEAKKVAIDLDVQQGQMQSDRGAQAKQEIDTEIAQRKQTLDYQAKQASFAKDQQDIQQSILDQEVEALGIAKDKYGLLQSQVQAIQQNADLTKEQKANELQLLEIAKEQAAIEVYRRQVAVDTQTKRVSAQAAMMTGQTAYSRELQNQADLEQANATEQQRIAEYTATNIASRQYATNEEAKAAAVDQAAQERKNDALSSFLEKQKQLASMTISTAVGAFTPNTDNFFSQEEAEAGRAAGFGVSDNQIQMGPGGNRMEGDQAPPSPIDQAASEWSFAPGTVGAQLGRRPADPWIYGDLGPGPSQRAAALSGDIPQLGGPSPLDDSGGRHFDMTTLGHGSLTADGARSGARNYSMDSILGAIHKPMNGATPILTEAQKQTDLLKKIAENTDPSKTNPKGHSI